MLNKIETGPDLARVVMPLVKVMRDAAISWSDREVIADAILASWRNWQSMADEQRSFNASAAYGQCERSQDTGGLRRAP